MVDKTGEEAEKLGLTFDISDEDLSEAVEGLKDMLEKYSVMGEGQKVSSSLKDEPHSFSFTTKSGLPIEITIEDAD